MDVRFSLWDNPDVRRLPALRWEEEEGEEEEEEEKEDEDESDVRKVDDLSARPPQRNTLQD